METTDLAALRTSQIVALTTSQIVALTTDQVAALTTGQVEALTTSQIAAFTTTQTPHLALGTPLVLDLNGDGINTVSVSGGVQFDLFATGQRGQTGWVAPTDGLLALDRNGNGSIDNGSELFGSSTLLASGQRAANGFEALAALDSNGDGVVSAADSGWKDLRVWTDTNSDGISEAGELKTLDSLGISKLNVAATATNAKDNGNWIGLKSGFETTDGATHDLADVWFVAKNPATAVPVDATGELRTRVTGLVQAMAAFGDTADREAASGWNLDPNGSAAAPQSLGLAAPVAGNVAQMVDTLRNFDINGQTVAGTGPSAPFASPGASVALAAARNPANAGFLGTDSR